MITMALILTPFSLEAKNSSLQDRVEQRRLERLNNANEEQKPNEIRIGKTIRQTITSPRRISAQSNATVLQVADGSVVQVRMSNGELQTIRTLGSEAPVIREGSKKEQCFALLSKEKLANLLVGKEVHLQKDDNFYKDNDGRLLRYVYVATQDIGAWMIRNGYAFSDKENSHRKQSYYNLLEQEAKEDDRGLWSPYCEYNPNPAVEFEILQ